VTQEPAQDPAQDPATPALDASTPAVGTQIWEQQPGEPTRWYDRFHRYMLDGRRRAILQVYLAEWRREKARKGAPPQAIEAMRQPATIPGAWGQVVAAWAWRERAAAWDAYQRQIEDDEFAEERRADRRARIQLNRGLRGWAAANIPYLPRGPERCLTCDHGRDQHRRVPTPEGMVDTCVEGCTCTKYIPSGEIDVFAVIKAAQVSTQELRKEYGDEPAQRLEHSGTMANVNLNTTSNDLAGKSDEELEEEIGQFEALLRHIPPGSPSGTSPPTPHPPAPGDPGSQEPPLDEP